MNYKQADISKKTAVGELFEKIVDLWGYIGVPPKMGVVWELCSRIVIGALDLKQLLPKFKYFC